MYRYDGNFLPRLEHLRHLFSLHTNAYPENRSNDFFTSVYTDSRRNPTKASASKTIAHAGFQMLVRPTIPDQPEL